VHESGLVAWHEVFVNVIRFELKTLRTHFCSPKKERKKNQENYAGVAVA
jgi:hypothetical protein